MKNPDGTNIYEGQAIYKDKDGNFADAFYIEGLLRNKK